MSPRDKSLIGAGRVDSPRVDDLVPEEAAALVEMKYYLDCVLQQKTYSPRACASAVDALPEVLEKELTVSPDASKANHLHLLSSGGASAKHLPDVTKFEDIAAIDHAYVRAFCDDYCLLRYLRAREWNLEKAFTMLAETLRWRWTKRPDQLKYGDVAKLAQAGSIYPNGFDKSGRPIMYMRARRDPPGTTDEKLDQILYTMEEGVRSMDASKGVEKFVYIIDLAGFSVTQAGADPKLAQAWINVLQNHYPERLKLVCVVDAGMIFTGFWNIISYFIDTETRKKMTFISKAQFKKELATSDIFDAQHVEEGFGGEVPELITDDASEKYLASLKAASKNGSGHGTSEKDKAIGSRTKSTKDRVLGSLFG
ncbi:Random slug protein 5 [Porphyridium purpureum]|uniref:Random slug protein 5 n=1 Tax=Porphyridium purpureum TaxID=35688 RepID=A0A5J4YNZ2_PORPP|nr:Random slug protein 5 [Porphyridium purpureum]|eukprot:POR9409..scf222_8